MASPEIASSVCDDVGPPQQPDVTVTESDRNVSDHPTGSSSTSPPPPLTGAAASPILGAAASPEPPRQPDEDGIHLAPNGAGGPGSPEKAAMGAAERRSSFVQMEGRARSRSVGEKQWTRVRAVMAWYTRLRRIKKSVVFYYPLLRRFVKLNQAEIVWEAGKGGSRGVDG